MKARWGAAAAARKPALRRRAASDVASRQRAAPASARVAVDVVIFAIDGSELQALLVRVRNGPFAGHWAFPGGLVPAGEAPEETATRELLAQTGIGDVYLEQLRTFGDPGRDPGAHVVSIAYFALLPSKPKILRPPGKYAGMCWVPVRSLPALAYDHNDMAACALERLRAKLAYTNVAYSLLPERFTLGELQEVYETILGRPLDRRNFRKKVLALRLLQPLAVHRRGPHRPARLYRFRRRSLAYAPIL